MGPKDSTAGGGEEGVKACFADLFFICNNLGERFDVGVVWRTRACDARVPCPPVATPDNPPIHPLPAHAPSLTFGWSDLEQWSGRNRP